MRPLAAIANERLLRLHFSQFRSLPIKNNTDTIVLPSTVVTTQGENGLPPSGAGDDFSFASSDFKTLGAFFCNIPGLDWRRLQSRRRVGQRERRAGAGEAARLDRLSVRSAGEASEILSRFRAISMLCEAENFPSVIPRASNSTTFLRLPAGAHGQPARPVPDVVASRLPSYYHFRARIQSFQAVAALSLFFLLPSQSRAARQISC